MVKNLFWCTYVGTYASVLIYLSKRLRDCLLEMITRFDILVTAFPKFHDSSVFLHSASFSICELLDLSSPQREIKLFSTANFQYYLH